MEPGPDRSGEQVTPGEAVHLLVVDDEIDMESLFRLRFRRDIREGRLDLRFLSDPAEAIDVVAENPDLEVIITDLNMPEVHGLELIERIETMDRPVKIIVLTAYGDMPNIRAAMMRGAFDFLVKPLDVKDLKATLSKAAGTARKLRSGRDAVDRARELTDRNRFVEEVFGRHVSKDVMTHLLASPSGLGQSERRELTVFMADIRGFSHLAERLAPEDSVQILNDYLEVATDVILAHNGTIIEILGDGLLVFFGAPVEDPRAPQQAASAALELMEAMCDLNERFSDRDFPELAIGIGIHTGPAIVGTLGSKERQKYAAFGTTVNLVSRIEDQTLGGQVLISDATYQALGPIALTRGSCEIRLKGISEPVTVHDLVGLGPPFDVRLPDRFADLVRCDPPSVAEVGLVVNNRISGMHPAKIQASSAKALQLVTDLPVGVLDEVVVEHEGTDLFGKVSEVSPETSEILVAITSTTPH